MQRVLCAVILGGCWTTTRTPAPLISNTSSAPRAHVTTRSERWIGTGRQFDDNSTWDMVLTLRPSAQIGEELGTISYPSLACSGRAIREPDDDDALVGRERITDDPEHHCVDGGAMIIPRERGATFLWRWRQPTGEAGAEATLSRDTSP